MDSDTISFAAFYRDVHSYDREPFEWQSALAERVRCSGWPRAISMPTASGKTSVLDIAVWHLACDISQGRLRREKRIAPLRIAMIVDRRISVDDSYNHAKKIAEALREERGKGAAAWAAKALRSASTGDPLYVKRLRGGIPQDSGWDLSPSDPTIILSTIDQIGSRLLFRGYGVSNKMRPVHAGLVGTDTLYILDEAHLSGPFVRMLHSIEDMRRKMGWETQGPVVQMSATLQADDPDATFPHPDDRQYMIKGMGDRMSRPKPATLQAAGRHMAPDKLARIAKDMMAKDGPRRIGIVVNTVGAARTVFEEVRSGAKRHGYAAYLLTGRSRPLDRERLVEGIVDDLRPGSSGHQKSVTVATQCIEAGADITFDALLTQAAPLDSLLQRFGRLNRIGAEVIGTAVVVADGRDIGANADDPVYGKATAATWSWLTNMSDGDNTVDFGPGSFQMPLGSEIEEMSAPKRSAATLLPAYVKAWHTTMPPGSPDPDVSLFLHGIPEKHYHRADVSVVWRAGVGLDDVEMSVHTVPPSALESIQLPIWHVRSWLEGMREGKGDITKEKTTGRRTASSLADIEGQYAADIPGKVGPEVAVRVGPRGRCERIGAGDVGPGDTVVVPSSYRGCDEYGWTGSDAGEPVTDISMLAHLVQRGKLALRSDGASAGNAATGDVWSVLRDAIADEDDDSSVVDILSRTEGLPGVWRDIVRRDRKAEVIRRPDGTVFGVSFTTTQSPTACRKAAEPIFEDAPDMISEYSIGWKDGKRGGTVPLDDHLEGVARTAAEFAKKSGLGDSDSLDIEIAARIHDIGKRERIMQAVLHGTTQEGVRNRPAIAKSNHRSKGQQDAAKRLACMPDGYRHEWFSVQRARSGEGMGRASDPDLVMWLIGTHHGHGRPTFPTGTWDTGLDPWWCRLVERAYLRYGPWKLANMEAILRLADGRRSGEERRDDGKYSPEGAG